MPLRDEVRRFIGASEHIQDLLAGGGRLTEDERNVIETTAIELLAAIRPSKPTPDS
jgi:hypothetical protein